MTLAQLQSVPGFFDLGKDLRFASLLAYLRANPAPRGNKLLVSDATAIIRSEGAWHGWFECLEKCEEVTSKPPIAPPASYPRPKYRNPNPEPETK